MSTFSQREKDLILAHYAQRCDCAPVVSHNHIYFCDWGYQWTIWKLEDGRIQLTQDGDEDGEEPGAPICATVEELLGFLILHEEIEGMKEVDAIMAWNAR